MRHIQSGFYCYEFKKKISILYLFKKKNLRVVNVAILGPLLFLLHINDLPSVVSSKVRLFADDCLLYRNIEDQIVLQKDLNLLENWGNTWGMRFNAAKRNIMQVSRTRDLKLFNYSLTEQVLEEVMDAKYLGVTLSNNLEWSKHIATMTNKANSKLSFLRRNLKDCKCISNLQEGE